MKVVHFVNAAEGMIKRLLSGNGPVVPKTTHPPLVNLSERLGIEIITDYDCDEPSWSFKRLSEKEKVEFGNLLCFEFAIYNREVIRAAGIDRIFLCTGLNSVHEAQSVAGFTDMGMFAMNSLVLRMTGNDPRYSSRTVHHEIFHAIDYSDDLLRFADPSWKKLDEDGFLYDREMQFRPDRGGNRPCFMDGFTTSYSRMAVQEDKAELYASMIIDYGYVLSRAVRDKVLLRKVERMKELLRNFHPHFDDKFWQLANTRSLAPATFAKWARNVANRA